MPRSGDAADYCRLVESKVTVLRERARQLVEQRERPVVRLSMDTLTDEDRKRLRL